MRLRKYYFDILTEVTGAVLSALEAFTVSVEVWEGTLVIFAHNLWAGGRGCFPRVGVETCQNSLKCRSRADQLRDRVSTELRYDVGRCGSLYL